MSAGSRKAGRLRSRAMPQPPRDPSECPIPDAGHSTRRAGPGSKVRVGALWSLLLLLSSACATPPPPALGSPSETGQLVLWRAQGGSGPAFHLLGTLHVGRTQAEFDPAIADALDAASVLALEIAPDALQPPSIAAALEGVGFLAGGTLFDVIGPDTADLLRRWLEASGTHEATVTSLKPWAVWLMVVSASLAAEGLEPGMGTESTLTRDPAAHLPVVGLETIAGQFAVIDALPDAAQETLLREALGIALIEPAPPGEAAGPGGASAGAIVDQMLDAWRKGDLDWLETFLANESGADYITVRNAGMLDGIEALLAAGEVPFVAVGLAHMVGERGLPTLLEARGYRVERIAKTEATVPPEPDEGS